ncbi:hypothetical protein N9E36_02780 [bacterium]|nr:hypothetical protein [bacterium]
MTPTYPPLVPSYVDGLVSAKMTMFNSRKDVDYFEIGVFDDEWNPVPFAATAKILRVPHGSSKTFEVFVRQEDKKRATFICSLSKLRTDSSARAIVSSKICSRTDGALP